ncbi:unnamed protein product [Rotaria sordida]|uniref:Uncharacterized protein n=1 Tax=Rotaria sordida TaxID=392033 RepID=A0A814YRP0_9BILA|nr:unnamed protein product [Rotaria sordida]CAF3973440.1 unnamed protein product [Rotaria sordida]
MRVYSDINRKSIWTPVPSLSSLSQPPDAPTTQLRSPSLPPQTVESHPVLPSSSMENMEQQTMSTRKTDI